MHSPVDVISAISSIRMEAHGAQLAVYSQALLAKITVAPVRAALCLLRSGQFLDLGQKV
jgi:hypothetical protein